MTEAVIFDMDGVMVNNFEIHLEAWKVFCSRHQVAFTESSLRKHAFGRSNDELMPYFFKREMTPAEIRALEEEKEGIYRSLYRGKVVLVEGLKDFLAALVRAGIKRAVASSAPKENVAFIMDEAGIAAYFPVLVSREEVVRAKPDPEIYLRAARLLSVLPGSCVVFEDSFAGIEAARKAGMKVVGVATTHPPENLSHCDRVIRNFTEITVDILNQLS